MTIQGALSDLNNLLEADDIPFYYKTSIKKIIETIEQEPKTEWIPVSERLPEDGNTVLFCDIDSDIMMGYHVKGRPNTHFSQIGTFDIIKNVRAWQPLPQPYERKRDNEDGNQRIEE